MQLRTIFRTAASEEELTDAVGAGYARWRRQTHAVEVCYRRWVAAARGERALAYAAYEAALEQEERAASAYRDLIEYVRGA
jgi:hypothetical protein